MNFLNIKLALRNFLKNKQFTFINIFGLAIGLASFILISLYIQHHYSFDKYHTHYNNIYRIDQDVVTGGQKRTYSCSPFPAAPILQKHYPEILKACRMRTCSEYLTKDKEHTYFESRGAYVDSTFFDLFDYEFVQGSAETSIQYPMSILLTEEMAQKYFPNENPMGKTLKMQGSHLLKVTGVYKKQPLNTDFDADYLISYASFPIIMNMDLDAIWDWCMIRTYVLLADGTNIEKLTAKLKDFQNEYFENPMSKQLKFWPLSKQHLQYNDENDQRPFFYLMGGVSGFILLLACINFINLSTAYSSLRVKEIGVRKVSGSQKNALVSQFLSEAFVLTLFSLLIALVLAILFLPSLNALINEHLELNLIKNYRFLLFIVATVVITGFISGSYPAFYLSSFIPALALRKGNSVTSGKSYLRNFLVVFQFIISIVLIISTLIIFQEVNLLKNKALGFNEKNVLVSSIQLTGENNASRYHALRNELLSDARILNIAWSHTAPFVNSEFWNVNIEGLPENQKFQINHNHIDFHFIETFGLEVVEGRNLSEKFPTDKEGGALLSRKAVEDFGWDSCGAVGKIVYNDGTPYHIVGIVEDFHQFSVTAPIAPYFMSYTTREYDWPNMHAVRIAENQDIIAVNKFVTQKFQEFFPDAIIEFRLLDENLEERNFGFVKDMGALIGIFSFLAIAIAIVGLFGLVSFVTKQRTKSIGVRKVNGAKVFEIMVMFNKEFVKWISIAFIFAAPLAYFLMSNWLEEFAYRVDLKIWVFISSGVFALIVALITISAQTYKAANGNPVDALRYE